MSKASNVTQASKALRNAEKLHAATLKAFDLYQRTKMDIGCDPDMRAHLNAAVDNALLRLGLAQAKYMRAIANEATRRGTYPAK